MKLDKQDPRAQKLARDIAALIREYEAETENRIEALSIEKPAVGLYDVQLQIRLRVRSLDTFTHDTGTTHRRLDCGAPDAGAENGEGI